MYAPLQAVWTHELVLKPYHVARHIKALWLAVICITFFGWTWACIAVTFFYVYNSADNTPIQLNFSPYHVIWKQGDKVLSGYPNHVNHGFCWISLRLQSHSITLWEWQMSTQQWRQFCALTHRWAEANKLI